MTEVEKLPSNPSAQPTVTLDPAQALQFAIANPAIPKIYTNHFSTIVETHDFALLLGQSGSVSGVVFMSYPLAKALGKAVTEAVANYETQVAVTIPDVVTLEAGLKTKS